MKMFEVLIVNDNEVDKEKTNELNNCSPYVAIACFDYGTFNIDCQLCADH